MQPTPGRPVPSRDHFPRRHLHPLLAHRRPAVDTARVLKTVPKPAAAPGSTSASVEAETPIARRRLIFGIVAVALFMSAVDQSIVATAIGSIQTDLNTSISWVGWTITAYALGQVIAMPLAGRLSDQFGRKRIFLWSVGLFTAASLACGLAGNIYLLVFFRVLQAIGGGAFMPSATGIVADHFGKDRDRAIGLFTSVFPIGGMVGPVIGSVIVTYWSWREIFLVNVPIGIALVVLGAKFLPKSPRRVTGTVDPLGVALFAGVLLSAMAAVTYLGTGTSSATDLPFLLLMAAALVSTVLFIRHIKRHPSPVIPSRFLYGPGFGIVNLLNFVYGAAALGFAVLVPIYVEGRYNLDLLQAGTLLTARAPGMTSLAGLAVFALRRTGIRLPMAGGFLMVALGLAAMALIPVSAATPFLWLTIAAIFTGMGTGLAVPASNNAGLHLAPDNVAVIAGLRGMFRQSGAIVAVSVATAVMARSVEPSAALAAVFLVSAAVLVAAAAAVRFIPEHKGSW